MNTSSVWGVLCKNIESQSYSMPGCHVATKVFFLIFLKIRFGDWCGDQKIKNRSEIFGYNFKLRNRNSTVYRLRDNKQGFSWMLAINCAMLPSSGHPAYRECTVVAHETNEYNWNPNLVFNFFKYILNRSYRSHDSLSCKYRILTQELMEKEAQLKQGESQRFKNCKPKIR